MQWFKHQSDLRDSAWVAPYLAACDNKAEGYGILLMILEKVNQEFDGDSVPSATFDRAQWGRITQGSHHRATKYLGKLDLLEGVSVEYPEGKGEGNVRVNIPNLLEWKERFSRREQTTSEHRVNRSRRLSPAERVRKKISEESDVIDVH